MNVCVWVFMCLYAFIFPFGKFLGGLGMFNFLKNCHCFPKWHYKETIQIIQLIQLSKMDNVTILKISNCAESCLRGKAFNLSPLNMVKDFSQMPFIRLRKLLLLLVCWEFLSETDVGFYQMLFLHLLRCHMVFLLSLFIWWIT